MYSPKIKEDLIPVLYRLGKQKGKPITKLIDEILRKELAGTLQLEEDQLKPLRQ